MPTAVVVMMFCASAPLFINLVLWVGLYFQVSTAFSDASIRSPPFPFRTGAVGMLIAWLLLLRYVLQRNTRRSENSAPL